MADFYAKNAVLVGTFSEPIEIGKGEVLDYFINFLDKANLTCTILSNVNQALFCGLIISSGTYLFKYTDKDGKKKRVYARYTYCFKQIKGEYKIINHHSSELPEV